MCKIRAFETMEDGMEHCEAQFLELAVAYGLIKAPRAVMDLEDTLRLQIGADVSPLFLGPHAFSCTPHAPCVASC